jgi:hypothetical protein
LALGQTAQDDISPGERGFERHTDTSHKREQTCT